MTKAWIKDYLDTLEDPKLCRLPDKLWRRARELSLLAGKTGNDGALPSVEDMAWVLRLAEDELLENIHSLAEEGIVFEKEPGKWFVTGFKERQACESYDRVKRYRERYRNSACNEEGNAVVAEVVSTSTSTSTSDSISDSDSESISTSAFNSISDPDSESEGLGAHAQPPKHAGRRAVPVEEERPAQKPAPPEPTSPAEAMNHPDVKVYTAATGRIPGATQYRPVIETMRFLRAREKLDDPALAHYLAPYWLAWSTRKRKDGHPYDPGNLTWLTEWALNKTIPPVSEPKPSEYTRAGIPSVEQTRKMLDERDKILAKAVPPPPEVIAAMQEFKKKLAQGR